VVVRNIVAFIVLSLACFSQIQNKSATPEEPVFRDPFTLKLHVDKEHYYEETFDRVPYVAENEVYLFAGETFGVNVTITESQLSGITYQRDPSKADVALAFTQESSAKGWIMMLVIQNRLKRKLYLNALMTLPGKKEIFNTSVLPVEPNLSDYESWPHPIVQLVLRNFRFSENGSKPARGEKPSEHSGLNETVDPKTGNVHLAIPVMTFGKPKQQIYDLKGVQLRLAFW